LKDRREKRSQKSEVRSQKRKKRREARRDGTRMTLTQRIRKTKDNEGRKKTASFEANKEPLLDSRGYLKVVVASLPGAYAPGYALFRPFGPNKEKNP